MSNGTFRQSIKLQEILLGWAGIQVFPKKDVKGLALFVKSRIFYIKLIWLASVLIGELFWLADALSTGQNFEDVCTTVPCFTMSILGVVKFNCLYYNRNVVLEVVEKLRAMHPEDDEVLDNTEKEGIILKNTSKFLRTVMKFFSYLAVAVLLPFGTATAGSMVYDYVSKGSTEYKLPFRVKYFFEVSDLVQWTLLYVQQIGSMLVVCIDLLSADMLFYAFCTYLQMHFRLLCLQFENFVSKTSKSETKENFRRAVRRHQELIELVEQIELLYSKSTLCNIILSSLLICLCGFIVTFVHDIGAVSSFLTFLMMNLSQISLLCFFGDMLNSASTRVAQAIYTSNWYEAEPNVRKNVLIVIISMGYKEIFGMFLKSDTRKKGACNPSITDRAQRPCKLTAMKYADLNLNALSAILRTSWSYFALLRTMYD